MNAYFKRSKINHLSFYLVKLDKEEQIRMNLVPVLHNEVRQEGKSKHCMLTHMHGI